MNHTSPAKVCHPFNQLPEKAYISIETATKNRWLLQQKQRDRFVVYSSSIEDVLTKFKSEGGWGFVDSKILTMQGDRDIIKSSFVLRSMCWKR